MILVHKQIHKSAFYYIKGVVLLLCFVFCVLCFVCGAKRESFLLLDFVGVKKDTHTHTHTERERDKNKKKRKTREREREKKRHSFLKRETLLCTHTRDARTTVFGGGRFSTR